MSMLKKIRLEKELSQEEMAKKLEISPNGYRNYESGKRLLPTDVLIKVLQIRGYEDDLKLVAILEELCVKKTS